MLRKCFIV